MKTGAAAGAPQSDAFLEGIVVVELGDRAAVGLCGALLQRLGAESWVIDDQAPESAQVAEWCAAHRTLLRVGKGVRSAQAPEAAMLLARADVIITSTDARTHAHAALERSANSSAVVCDVSAFGSSGPLAGARYSDAMVQAFAGLVDTTGAPGADPVASRVPIAESSAAVFAASGVLAALRSRRSSATPQRVEVALFDTAVSMLSTFLPAYFTGGAPRRIGNRHPSMSPWNAYAASDGWVLLCSASDDMWGRVCAAIDRPELRTDPALREMAGRVQNADAADAALGVWIAAHNVAQCLEVFNAASVPCGPVYTIAEMLADPNLCARGAVASVEGKEGERVLVPGRLIHGAPAQARLVDAAAAQAYRVQARDARAAPASCVQQSADGESAGVLSGVRVVEMGSYTTAPLAARNLGALGAYVVKAEPPAGDLARASPPYRDGQSYLCTISNSDKRAVAVDLRVEQGRALFRQLLARADVFVENMKPGALARFGFGREEVLRLNPRMVYCSVSGFGADSPLADRPAMDATIQGAAGIMDLTRGKGVPYKTGVSISDLVGGQFALLSILAGLEYRERTGRGQFIDLSMQELSAWLTQFFWNAPGAAPAAGAVLRVSDGYVYVTASDATSDLQERIRGLDRREAIALLSRHGCACAPVHTVSEVAVHPQTQARELIVTRPAKNGSTWPLLACPIRLRPSAAVVRRALGRIGEDLDEVVRDWGLEGMSHPPARGEANT